ncbi:hypothetical protein RHS03_05795, partial [Rhizoctonia solani]
MASQFHDSDEEISTTPPGSTKENKSRNARAQARLRARRKAYVESLEANVKRLQTIVDAVALNPNRVHATTSAGTASPHLLPPFGGSPETSSSDPSTVPQQPSEAHLQQLQTDNARLRRERDALKVQIDALTRYISRGYSVSFGSSSPSGDARSAGLSVDRGLSPNFGSDVEIESHTPMTDSPLIQRDAYTQDELNQLLSLNDADLAFIPYLDFQGSGPLTLHVPHSIASGESSSGQTGNTANFPQGNDASGSNLMFRAPEP